ncbi:hypothetical protein AGR1C_Lc90066 [Agrobacterium fabacearum TT111]|nr:hypothetical protein AGR1C_Lc90066 [Agrobacterium fabacearum TT111]
MFGILAILRDVDDKIFRPQAGCDAPGKIGIVFNEKYAHGSAVSVSWAVF